jgi:hypothetical protein
VTGPNLDVVITVHDFNASLYSLKADESGKAAGIANDTGILFFRAGIIFWKARTTLHKLQKVSLHDICDTALPNSTNTLDGTD